LKIIDKSHFRIKPTQGWLSLDLDELWEYRELLYFLAWRDIRVRYKQTALGVAWAVLQPLLTMLVFTVFLGKLAKVPSDGIPYPIFTFSALVPWTFFANGLAQSSTSLVLNANLLKKVYFPRLVIPISSVLSGGVDFLISFLVLVGMMLYYGMPPTMNILCVPLLFALTTVISLGTGLWLSALNVEYRDIRYVVPFLTQFWMFATPIAYPSSLLSERWRLLYGLNPMVGIVDGFRWALLGVATVPSATLVMSSIVSVGLLVTGALYFRRMERTFADVV